jgi:hypothetical protein
MISGVILMRKFTPPCNGSPLDVKGVDLGLSAEAIVEIIREIREG